MNNVITLAKYIIQTATCAGIGISHTKLQTMLLLIFKDYFVASGGALFSGTFIIDSRCPIIEEVWEQYRGYGGATIFVSEDVTVEVTNKTLLDELIIAYAKRLIEDLVSLSMAVLNNSPVGSRFSTEELMERWRK